MTPTTSYPAIVHSRYRQVGNAVPPLLGKAIGDVVMGILRAVEETREPPLSIAGAA